MLPPCVVLNDSSSVKLKLTCLHKTRTRSVRTLCRAHQTTVSLFVQVLILRNPDISKKFRIVTYLEKQYTLLATWQNKIALSVGATQRKTSCNEN